VLGAAVTAAQPLTVPQELQTLAAAAAVPALAAAAQSVPAVRAVQALLFCLYQLLDTLAQPQVRLQLRLQAPTQF
jgi:hypothetical protein